jgi:mono/diheme cytochrome c family protein
MRFPKGIMVAGLLALPVLMFGLAAGPARAQGVDGDPDNGAQLYADNCAVCHGPNGEGRSGAELNDVFVTIAPDVFLEEVISRGREGTFMPAWSEDYGGPLTASEIDDIVAYIESWGTTVEPPMPAPNPPPKEIPPVPQVDGDPNVGYTIYQQNCLACHGPEGEGRIGAELQESFASVEPGAFAITTISRGIEGSLMPAFAQEDGGPLTDQQINDVAAYVFSIQHPAGPGPAGEVVGRASGWPLAFALLAVLILLVALGLVLGGRPPSEEDDHADTG